MSVIAQGVSSSVLSQLPELSIRHRVESCELKEVLATGAYENRYFAWDDSLSAWVTVVEYAPRGLATRVAESGELLPLPEFESLFRQGLEAFVFLGRLLAERPSSGLERVLRVVEDLGTAYWILDPAPGTDLREYLKNHPEPMLEREVVRLAHHLLVALASLHREDHFHAAVAPENIVLLNAETPILVRNGETRFWLAQRENQLDDVLIPGFSAPELSAAARLSPLCDLYGLGACLYLAMTRRLLPLGDTSPVPPFTQAERRLYSSGILQIVARLTHPLPEERFQSVLEALQALARLTAQDSKRPPVGEKNNPPPVTEPVSARRGGSRWLGGIALAVTAALLVGYWLNRSDNPLNGESGVIPAATTASPSVVADGPDSSATGPATDITRQETPRPLVLPARRVFQFSDPLKTGGSAPEMVVIPPGEFLMGDAKAVGQSSEVPVHRVRLERSIAISRFEVTFDDFERFSSETGRYKPGDEGWGRGTRPVINVSYNDIQAYLAWLREQTGRPYRLPSEAEWEYAARAGARGLNTWGDRIGVGNAVCDGCGSEFDATKTAPVGSFAPNAFGLYDMQGNVAEWVQDCWTPDYTNAPSDGAARMAGNCGFRVWRGGSWADLPRALRLSARTSYPRDYRSNQAGIRLALDL